MKYNVGDKVRIKSLDWYNENKDNYGAIYAGSGFCFWKNMARHCGEIMKITSVKVDPEDSNKGYYFMENSEERWTDEMIEGLVEEENNPKFKIGDKIKLKSTLLNDIFGVIGYESEGYRITNISNGLTYFMSYSIEHCYELVEEEEIEFTEEDKYWCDIMSESDPTTYVLPQGYQFVDENGNVINATKIVLEKKSPKTDAIINWLREHDMTKHIGVIYSGMCSITFDTEGLITDFLKTAEDDE